MADNPNRTYFSRSQNPRGRSAQRQTYVNSRPNNRHFHDYVGDETITFSNTNLSLFSMRGNFRNRIGNRFFDNYNRQVPHSLGSNQEITNEHTQDNKNTLQVENGKNVNSDTTQQSSSIKTNNNIGSLINRNSVTNTHDDVTKSWSVARLPARPTQNPSNESMSLHDPTKHIDLTRLHPSNESVSQLDPTKYTVMNSSFFSLPKRELNLSPTRVSPIRAERENPSPSSNTLEPIQGATASDFTSGCAPSTSSNCVEAAGTCPRPITKRNEAWINAPEFHPKSRLNDYVKPKKDNERGSENSLGVPRTICPVIQKDGMCRFLPHCPYLHGEKCDLCHFTTLHPTDEEERTRHRQECLERYERKKELSSAIARSKEKTCGICFEVVVEKESFDRRFGILNQCNHCFCLSCIRRWRQASQFEHKVVKACPECRVTSNFVCPSQYWVETKEDKENLIESYKKVLSQKACKYFNQGRGSCPFGNKCFYLHALPDGTKTDVGPPRRRNYRRQGDRMLGFDLDLIVWDVNDGPENHWPYTEVADSDSDDSDVPDYECSFQ